MKINRKWVVGIGVAALIGLVFWMRALASWRPVTVAKVGFSLSKIQVSRDGNWLLSSGRLGGGAVVDLEKADLIMDSDRVRAFAQEHGTETFPHISWEENATQPDFWPSSGHKIPLTGLSRTSGVHSFSDGTLGFPVGWSKERGEVYGALNGKIFIWDWTSGKLKKRVRYEKSVSSQAVFSPDGKWLLATEEVIQTTNLRRYDVQTGKVMAFIKSASDFNSLGFSLDNHSLWFAWLRDANYNPNFTLNVIRTSDSKHLWSTDAYGVVKWLPDGQVGILQSDGFEWRDASGRLLRHLRGPFQITSGLARLNVTDWALSPDGNWIYTCQATGEIQRWRAR